MQKGRYRGYASFSLPGDIPAASLADLSIKLNLRGGSLSTDTWSIYDWNRNIWVKMGDLNMPRRVNQWRTVEFRISPLKDYVSAGNEIRIQFYVERAKSDVQLDYEILQVLYSSNLPAPTATFTPTPTAIPSATPH